jgi:F-type H+-transporting ATPase subunit delta
VPVRGGAGGRYAAALFSIAKERGQTDAWATQIQKLGAAVGEAGAMRVLTAPGLSISQKQQAIESVAGPLAREVSSLLTLLLERKRINQLPALAEAFADLVRRDKGIELAEVTTAVPLNDADRQGVAAWLTRYLGHAVEVRYNLDSEIIGGVVARVGDQLIDGSVRGRLEALRRTLAGAQRV